jgi:hypothetical protein
MQRRKRKMVAPDFHTDTPLEIQLSTGEGSDPINRFNNVCPKKGLIWHVTLEIQYGFVNYKKGALDSQPHVIKFTSCLPMVGGSLRVLRLLPPLKLVDII